VSPAADASRRVAANVRAEMARRAINGAQLAERIGVSPDRLRRRLRGEAPFDVDELDAVAAALDVEARDLFG
jgi:transcriptional regulator with XRE-family HTH domain